MTPAWFVTSIWSLGISAAANLPQQSVARVGPVAPKAFSVGAAYLVPTSQCGVTFIVPMTATGLTCVMRACKLIATIQYGPLPPSPKGAGWKHSFRAAVLNFCGSFLARDAGSFGRLKQRAAEMVKDGGPPLRHNTGER